MLVHLGEGISIPARQIIAVLDLEKSGGDFLAKQQEMGRTVIIGREKSRSAVIAEKTVYLSPIRSATLLLRSRPSSSDYRKTALFARKNYP